MKANLKLYNYFRSSASYRARIALHAKGLEFEYIPVHLVKDGGHQHSAEYRRLNPMGHVPCLVHGEFVLAESMAIIDYLDRVFPGVMAFPAEPQLRARAIQICEIVNSGIQPLQNLKLLQDFEKSFGWGQDQKDKFVQHWVGSGLASLEKVLETTAGRFAIGDEVTAADMFIVPQMFSSRRFKVDTAKYPILTRIEKTANELPAFQKAHPERQMDYEK